MYQINVYNSIAELKKEDWNFLAENNVFMCYEFLKTFEETTAFPLTPFYIVVLDKENIIAASVCYLEQKNNARIIDRILMGRLHKYMPVKISFLPALICNRQRGDGTHFIFSSCLEDNQKVLLQNKMLDEIEIIAKNNKASLCFLNVTEDEKNLVNNLINRGYFNTFDLPYNFMEVKWSSFEEYKKYISQKHPATGKNISSEQNRNKKKGVIIERLTNIDEVQSRLIELLKMNYFKYNSSLFPFKQNYFKQIKENFGNYTLVYAAVKKGIIIGVSVIFQKEEEAYFANIGVDHALSQNDLTYFNLNYEALKHISKSNVKHIYYGRGLYKTKIKRGCELKDMYVFYKPKNKIIYPFLILWFVIHKQWMMKKILNIKKLLD